MEETLFTTYHSLILGALKKYYITPSHPEFDDYLQHARIELLLTHRDYQKQPETELPLDRLFIKKSVGRQSIKSEKNNDDMTKIS